MKVIKSYSALTIVTDITVEAFKQAKKFAPEALTLYVQKGEDKFPVYTLMYNPKAPASVDKFGISFNAYTEDRKLYATIMCTEPANDKNRSAEIQKQQILEQMAGDMASIKLIEEQVAAALAAKEELIASVEDAVEIQ